MEEKDLEKVENLLSERKNIIRILYKLRDEDKHSIFLNIYAKYPFTDPDRIELDEGLIDCLTNYILNTLEELEERIKAYGIQLSERSSFKRKE